MGDLLVPVKDLLLRSWNFLLKFIFAVVIFVIGWLVAKLIKALVVKALKTLRIDSIAEQVKITEFLSKGGITYTVSEIFGVMIYWIILLGVLSSALSIISLTSVTGFLDAILGYLPNVVGALITLTVGILIAAFVSSIVRATAANVGITQTNLLSKTTQVAIVIFTLIIVLSELKVWEAAVDTKVNILLGTVGLAAALSFGLGCKDIAARFIGDLVEKLKSKK